MRFFLQDINVIRDIMGERSLLKRKDVTCLVCSSKREQFLPFFESLTLYSERYTGKSQIGSRGYTRVTLSLHSVVTHTVCYTCSTKIND